METKPFDFARMIRRMKEDKAAINQYLEQHTTLKGFKGAKIYKPKEVSAQH